MLLLLHNNKVGHRAREFGKLVCVEMNTVGLAGNDNRSGVQEVAAARLSYPALF